MPNFLPSFIKTMFARQVSANKKSNEDKRLSFDANRPLQSRKALCYAPSVNMVFAQDGSVKACCHNSENLLGKYPNQTISEIWSGAAASQFRSNMTAYNFLSGCKGCERDFNSGNYAEMSSSHFDHLERHSEYPTMMEFLLENTCNLECVMCHGELSSSIRRNRDKLPPIISPYDDKFVNQLIPFIPYLREVRFSGAGEAFSISMNFKIWDLLIELNPNCLIVLQTNGTIMNERVKDYLSKGNFQIGVSVDSLQKESYETIRKNADFESVMENIRYFSLYSQSRNKPFTISTCVMRENWKELPSFVNFCNSIQAHVTFHKVYTPLQYALHNLPKSELREISAYLKDKQFENNNAFSKKNAAHYRYFVGVIDSWAEEAIVESAIEPLAENLDYLTLLTNVKKTIANYLHASSILEQDKELALTEVDKKLDELMEACTSEEQRCRILNSMISHSTGSVISSLRRFEVDRLVEMSKGYIQ